MDQSVDELNAKLSVYREQLSQVEELLSGNPTNDQLLKIKADLVEVIAITIDLVRTLHALIYNSVAFILHRYIYIWLRILYSIPYILSLYFRLSLPLLSHTTTSLFLLYE
jgi:hypothetical protein